MLMTLVLITLQICQISTEGFGILTYGGYYEQDKVHLFGSLSDPAGCPTLPLPERASGNPHGGMMNESITVCGGEMAHCYSLYEHSPKAHWSQSLALRATFASLAITYDNDVWTVFGAMQSVHEIWEWKLGGEQFEAHEAPIIGRHSCSVRRNQSHSIVSEGGHDVYWYEEEGKQFHKWDIATDLQAYRTSCGLVFNKDSGYQFVSVGGDRKYAGTTLDECEVFDFKSNAWIEGQKLSQPVMDAAQVQYQNTFVMIGGRSRQRYFDAYDRVVVYEGQDGWTEVPMKLPLANFWHGAMHTPSTKFTCV